MFDRKRELALFNLAIDSKLRGCDLVGLTSRFGAVRTLAAMHHQQNHIDIAGNLVTQRLNRSRMTQ
jgi:uncharacterized protein RhaS with RHS repeats